MPNWLAAWSGCLRGLHLAVNADRVGRVVREWQAVLYLLRADKLDLRDHERRK
jgi:hypothetical protein